MVNNIQKNLIGNLLNSSFKMAKTPDTPKANASQNQEEQLKKLLHKARQTAFGRHHQFQRILLETQTTKAFANAVPLTEYDEFYQQWLRFAHQDEPNICWPGIVPFYALSSGTSGASSKYIPVTHEIIADMKKATKRMFFDLAKYQLPATHFTRQMLMVGSCTAPQMEGLHHTGDLSGIIGMNRPLWLEPYYRPGKIISDMPSWQDRIDAIVKEAPKWDIGYAVANPMWLQLIFEQIIEKHQVQNIHDIWPNFKVLIHGGVFFEPYRPALEKMFAQTVHYVDSYAASEGVFAYQNGPNTRELQLLTDCGIYFEFIPFDDHNFDADGNLRTNAMALPIQKIEAGVSYAIVISSSAGLWRYVIGDTVIFSDVKKLRFKISGRTKQCLSNCGEHLSLDNINEAVRRADNMTGVRVREFSVAGIREGSGWSHQWWINVENPCVSPSAFMSILDQELMKLNDDYATERIYALKSVRADFVPIDVFHNFLKSKDKFNGQAKIPRVLKGEALERFMQMGATDLAIIAP